MFKTIAKWFIPSANKLAEYAADAIAKKANSALAGKAQATEKYSALSVKAANITEKIAGIIKDGKIDDAEEARIAAALVPLFEAVLALI